MNWLTFASVAAVFVLTGMPERIGRAIGHHYIRRMEAGQPYCHICGHPPARCPYTDGSRAAARCPESGNPP